MPTRGSQLAVSVVGDEPKLAWRRETLARAGPGKPFIGPAGRWPPGTN